MAANIENNALQAGAREWRARGVYVFGALMTLLFAVLAARLVELQVYKHQEMAVEAARQVYGTVRERDRRGLVIDSRGRTLAMSVEAKAVALDPKVLFDAPGAKPARLLQTLSGIINLSPADTVRLNAAIAKRVFLAKGPEGEVEKPIRFVWVKRRLSEEEWRKLSAAMNEAKNEAAEAWRYRRRWQKREGELKVARDHEGELQAREAANGWRRVAQEAEGKFAGVFFPPEYERVYPQGGLASHILGFGDIDGRGLEGIERAFEPFLKGIAVERLVARDARSRALSTLTTDDRSVEGMTVQLTIDSVVQSIAEDELYQVIEGLRKDFPDVVGHAVIMDPWTGDILALANYPTFDANRPGEFPARNRRNDAVAAVQEPGSTFKPLLFAASMEEGLANINEDWDCSTFRMDNGRTIKDIHPYGRMSLLMGLVKSSNPAMVRLGLRLGPDKMRQYVLKYGFGERTAPLFDTAGKEIGSLFPGEVRGRVTSAAKWSSYTMGSVPMGYEINVTSLQMAAAYSVIANGGMLPRPNLVKAIMNREGDVALAVEPVMRHRVLSEKTAALMRGALRTVVTEGTGRRANIKEYALGGKTGTANMIANEKERANGVRGYSQRRHTANFVALAPWDKPKAVICVSIRETGKYGGEASSPVVAGIARRMLAYWGVPADDGSKPSSQYIPVQEVFEKIELPPEEYSIGAEDDENRLSEEIYPGWMDEMVYDEEAVG